MEGTIYARKRPKKINKVDAVVCTSSPYEPRDGVGVSREKKKEKKKRKKGRQKEAILDAGCIVVTSIQ